MRKLLAINFLLFFIGILFVSAQNNSLLQKSKFKNPPNQFRPIPFWHINGELSQEGIKEQLSDAKTKANFGGVAVLPRTLTQPEFLSEEYFDKYKYILETAKEMDMSVILYDDINFPSGTAGGQIYKQYPEALRKELNKTEIDKNGPVKFQMLLPEGKLMAVVAMNMANLERINLKPFIEGKTLSWNVPSGRWKIMFFTCNTAKIDMRHMTVDYLDTTAIRKFLNLTYDKYDKHFGSYFQNTIQMSFFDDVGFWHAERTWTNLFNLKFKEINGFDPDVYYPALWYDIGDETEAARVAFFNTRAELLGEGYPKMIHQWDKKHGLKSTGHAPDNYGLQPVAMSGDIFKFYRHSDIPLADYIISYDRGRDGFKIISSASEFYDRPVTAVEIFGAFNEDLTDSLLLYRALMDIEARGINFAIPHGMWYDPTNVAIPPLISPFSKKLVPALPAFSNFAARTCYILQGGRRISDIALLYPIESLEAGYYFDAPNSNWGRWAYPEADYQKISGMLTSELHRDFTFVHPEYLTTEKYIIKKNSILLDNDENYQEYKLIIIPGGKVISVEALKKIKRFYDNGGKIIATTLLPSKSSEMGKDNEVKKIIAEMFGKNTESSPRIQSNNAGGKAFFIPNPTVSMLASIFSSFIPDADVFFSDKTLSSDKTGGFSYLHKVNGEKDIFFFANSSDNIISTEVFLRGKFQLEEWNPHTGNVLPINEISYQEKNGQIYTSCKLTMNPVTSVFWISK